MNNIYTLFRTLPFSPSRQFPLFFLILVAFSNLRAQIIQDFSTSEVRTNHYIDPISPLTQHVLLNTEVPQTQPNAPSTGDTPGYQVTYTPTRDRNVNGGLSDGELFGVVDVLTPVLPTNDMGSLAIDFVSNPPPGGNNHVYILDDPDGLATLRFNPVVIGAASVFSMNYIIHESSYENSNGGDDRVEIYLLNMTDDSRITLLSAINDDIPDTEIWTTLTSDLTAMEGQTVQLVVEFDTNSSSEEMAIDRFSFSSGTLLADWPMCLNPAVPSVVQSQAFVCPGVPFRINIAGDLNNATEWAIYSDEAATEEVGRTSSNQFDVFGGAAPGTTYYVRGEGGCTDAVALAPLMVMTNDPAACIPDATPGTSFEEPLGSSDEYIDTGDPTMQHDLLNNQGQPTVNHPFVAKELGFITNYAPDQPGSPNVGLTDGDQFGVSNDNDRYAFTDGNQGFVFEDTDGGVRVTFSPIDFADVEEVVLTFDYFVNSTTYEESDRAIDNVSVYLESTSGMLEAVIRGIGRGNPGLDGMEVGQWTRVEYTLPETLLLRGFEVVSLYIEGDLDASSEWVAFDNISFSAGTILCQDTEAPVVSCPNPIMIDADENCEGIANFTATATDDCSQNVAIRYSRNSGFSFTSGVTPVTVTATDESGKSSTCTFNVTVQDVTPPVAVCPDQITRNAGADCAVIVEFTPMAIDNCSSVFTYDLSNASGSTFSTGLTTVRITATDEAGLTGFCDFLVRVNDLTPPLLDCPDTLTMTQDAGQCSYTVMGDVFDVAATDNCSSPTLTNNFNDRASLAGEVFPYGDTEVTWAAGDNAGLSVTCVTLITITAPPFTCWPTSLRSNDASDFSGVSATPNPFTTGTTISFELPVNTRVDMDILDLSGRVITTEVIRPTGNNTYSWYWDAQQAALPAGVYFARLRAEGSVYTQRLVLMK